MNGLDQSYRAKQFELHLANKWIGLVQVFAMGDFQGKLVQLWMGLVLSVQVTLGCTVCWTRTG